MRYVKVDGADHVADGGPAGVPDPAAVRQAAHHLVARELVASGLPNNRAGRREAQRRVRKRVAAWKRAALEAQGR